EVELSAQIAKQSQDLITLRQFGREADASRALYEHFLTRLKETASQQGIQSADSRILSPAVIPFLPSEPRKVLIVSMSAIFGLAGSLCLVLLKELRRTNFRSRNALERGVGIQSLARLPVLPVNRSEDFIDYLNAHPKGWFSNSIRTLRTTLLLALTPKTSLIALTSAQSDEGCSTAAIALTHDLARLDKKVLLIDTSQSDDTLHAYFGDEPTRGISSVLRDEHGIDQTLHHPDILGADVLFANDPSVEAGDLYLSEKFEAFISEMNSRYDFVIINAPSITTSPTAIAVLKLADTVVMNVKWNATTKHQLHSAFGILNLTGVKVSGLVLSEVEQRLPKANIGNWVVRRPFLSATNNIA
ncbi:MAG: GNVR domain-containing protein, partial [Vibrio splendidus]